MRRSSHPRKRPSRGHGGRLSRQFWHHSGSALADAAARRRARRPNSRPVRRLGWWRRRGSNPRPSHCECEALPGPKCDMGRQDATGRDRNGVLGGRAGARVAPCRPVSRPWLAAIWQSAAKARGRCRGASWHQSGTGVGKARGRPQVAPRPPSSIRGTGPRGTGRSRHGGPPGARLRGP